MRPIDLRVDLTEAYRRLIHVVADLPVQPGTTAKLTTPLWLCESHISNGPVAYICGVSFTFGDNDSILKWTRDPFAPHVYLVDVPAHVHSIRATFDAITPRFVTRRMAILNWESALLHPWNQPVTDMNVEASIMIPSHWDFGTALATARKPVILGDKKVVSFKAVTVERLADSPIVVGEFISHQDATHDSRHIFHVATGRQTDIPKATITKLNRMIHETTHVFGTPPYRTYHFLLMMGVDHSAPNPVGAGSEHSESTFLLFNTDVLVDSEAMEKDGETIGHEYIHAWNGKYRRPVGHVPSNLTTPLDGSLLWIYEGLTQYYSYVISARAGLQSPSTIREKIATDYAAMANQVGRIWRSTKDVGRGVSLRSTTPYWRSWLRDGSDYYIEGVLVWLDADTLIRQQSGGTRSLDDFSRAFFSMKEDEPHLRPVSYSLQDVVEALEGVLHHDWAGFFRERILEPSPHANEDGIKRGGYRFHYADSPSRFQNSESGKLDCVWNTLGLRLDKAGVIEDVRRFGPSDEAKLAPGQVITHVAGEKFSVDAMLKSVTQAGSEDRPLGVTMQQGDDTWDCEIRYNGGLRYPTLERDGEEADILADILAPRCG